LYDFETDGQIHLVKEMVAAGERNGGSNTSMESLVIALWPE